MQLEFLGTGAGSPSKQRNVGEATQHQILNTTIRPRKIEKIFITHLHGDHIFGLPGLLSSRSFQGGTEPLTIYGPVGIKRYVQTSLQVSESRLSYPLHFVEITDDGELFNDHGFRVVTGLKKRIIQENNKLKNYENKKYHLGQFTAN